jgi:hypothetical protein
MTIREINLPFAVAHDEAGFALFGKPKATGSGRA